MSEWGVMQKLTWSETAIFLYDKDARRMLGVFTAKEVGLSLQAGAFGGRLPAQIEIMTNIQAAPIEFHFLNKILAPLIMDTIEFCNMVLKPDEVYALLEVFKTPTWLRK
mmetsp:Transcript_28638/g.39557  ORF Transcript_28638/g.39557 Transcript_28638/m.39557 type:complete len:109 (+) Transcript_28638:72-398(+)